MPGPYAFSMLRPKAYQPNFSSSAARTKRRGAKSSKKVTFKKGAKRGGAKSATKVHGRATELPNRAGTESSLVIKLRPKGLGNKVAAKAMNQVYTQNSNIVVSTAAGLQNAINLSGVFTPYDLTQMSAYAHEQGNAWQGVYTQEVFYKSCFQETMIQNTTNVVVRIQIWDFICRRDCFQDHGSNLLLPSYAFKFGLKDTAVSGTGTEYEVVGARPTDSITLNQFWKVKKCVYTDLAPGQVTYHRIHYKIMRSLNDEVMAQNNQGSVGFKGWTIYPMIVFYGAPCGDGVSGATTEAAKLNIVQTTNYHYAFSQESSGISTRTNNILTSTQSNIENLVTGTGTAYAAV